MSECNNIVDVTDLDTCTEIDNDSYLIVQNINSVCKAKISDLVLGANNVDFYPELLEIINKLDTIMSVLQSGSGDWNSTHSTVAAGSGDWDEYNDSPLKDVADDVKDNIDDWNATTTAVASNSGGWAATENTVALSAATWNNTADIVNISSENWNRAWVATTDGHQAIYEALELMEQMPWFTLYHDDGSAPPISSLWSLYTVVNQNSAGWE